MKKKFFTLEKFRLFGLRKISDSPYHVKGYIHPVWRGQFKFFLRNLMRDFRFLRFPGLKTNIFLDFFSGRAQNGRFRHFWPYFDQFWLITSDLGPRYG